MLPLTLAAIALVALPANLFAIPIVIDLSAPSIGDVPKNGTGIGGGNSNTAVDDFFRLTTFLSTNLEDCTPIFEGAVRLTGSGSNLDVDVTGFSFAAVHYGVGRGGVPGSGGGIEFFSIDGAGAFNFPNTGTGRNGLGAFSSLDLFKCAHNVPDGGSTVALLGVAIGVIGVGLRKSGF